MFRVCLLVLLMLLLLGGCADEETGGVRALTEPELPAQAPYPDESAFIDRDGNFDGEGFSVAYDAWWGDQRARPRADMRALNEFTRVAAPVLLAEENLFSPLNLYLALGMLSEVCDGDSRAQILTLLQQPDMEELRQNAAELWAGQYRDDGAAVSRLASSLWLRPDMEYQSETLRRLRETYYASVFEGVMGTGETNEALRRWIDEQTGGLLREQTEGLEFSENTLLALVSTIYYSARWSQTFSEGNTTPGVFHGVDGDEDCFYMKKSGSMTYHWGEDFAAVSLGLEEGRMELILPDEDSTPEALLAGEELWRFLFAETPWEQQKFLTVDLSLPRFDVSADMDLGEGLRQLGVRDVFDAARADFSPLCAGEARLSQARHGARLCADEEGVEAAAYTVMAVAGAAMPPEERVDFTLERPFLFLLRSQQGAPLFLGIVESVS